MKPVQFSVFIWAALDRQRPTQGLAKDNTFPCIQSLADEEIKQGLVERHCCCLLSSTMKNVDTKASTLGRKIFLKSCLPQVWTGNGLAQLASSAPRLPKEIASFFIENVNTKVFFVFSNSKLRSKAIN